MFQYLEADSGDMVAIRTSGKLGGRDLDALLPAVEARIRQYGKLRFYWEMEAFEGWEPLSFIRDIAFDIRHAADFKKIAMVGDKGWEQQMAGLMKYFSKAELRYFTMAHRHEALEWIRQ